VECLSVAEILSAFANLRRATVSFAMSVCPPAWNNSAATRRIFKKYGFSIFFENCGEI
jgi:predicted deacetylase